MLILIVGDLIIGVQTSEAGWSFLSLSTAAFSDRPVGYKTFKPIIKAMEVAGLIEISLGRNSQAIDFGGGQKPVYTPSLATRLKPTPLMAFIAKEAGIGDQAAIKHLVSQGLPSSLSCASLLPPP